MVLSIEILPVEMSQVLREIDPVLSLQLGGHRTVMRQITAGCGIFKTEGNSVPVGLGEKEFQRIVLKGVLNRTVQGMKIMRGTVPQIHDEYSVFIQMHPACIEKIPFQERYGRAGFVECIDNDHVIISGIRPPMSDKIAACCMNYS